jgi:hypothetical protein
MAKRGGKAATRRQRQRATAKPAAPRPVARPAAPSPATVSTETHIDTSTSTSVAAATPTSGVPTTPPRARPTLPNGLAGSSRLTEKAMAEYHYVRMDLRNIGILSLVLLALLAVAYVIVNVLGIGKQI